MATTGQIVSQAMAGLAGSTGVYALVTCLYSGILHI